MKKSWLGVFTMGLISIMLTGCCLSHDWEDATCISPQTCSKCGATKGDTSRHDWEDATCSAPKTCAVCGETKGETLEHEWMDATCSAPKTCAVCGETEGETLEHIWNDATCTLPKTCTVCGETEGHPLGHDWVMATCLMPQTCRVCGEEEGTTAEHALDWDGVCNVCGDSIGKDIEAFNYSWFLAFEYDWMGDEFLGGPDAYFNEQGFPYTGCKIIVTPCTEGYFEDVIISYRLTITKEHYADGRGCFEEGSFITGEFMLDNNGNGYEEAIITACRQDPRFTPGGRTLGYIRPDMEIEITGISGRYIK